MTFLLKHKKYIKNIYPIFLIAPLYFIYPWLIEIFQNIQFLLLLLLILLVVVLPINKNNWIALLVTFSAIITPSPIFTNIFGVAGNIFYAVAVVIISVLVFARLQKNINVIILSAVIILLQLFATLFWGEAKLMVLPLYFLSALFIVSVMQPIEINKFLTFASNILMLLLIGSLVGFSYVFFFHGEPLLYITNEDTRQNGLYLTTFSNWYVRGVIRPAGIYDEPGALSLITCLIAATRNYMGRSKTITWILLVLGSLTLSMAHIIYMLLHWVDDFRRSDVKLNHKHWLVLLIITIVIVMSPLSDVLNEFIFSRFHIVDGVMQGDNRSPLVVNAFNYLNWSVFFFGLDPNCIVNVSKCLAMRYNQFGDNPLGPLILGGIIQFFPYYAVIATLFFMALKRRSTIIFAVMLLLLQRNEVMSYGYAMLVMIFLVAMLKHCVNKKTTPLNPARKSRN